ncbi:MAG: hypothetical protein AAFR07_05680 [Pseudomonadota bacterium]
MLVLRPSIQRRQLLPAGGSQGQALIKASATDFDVQWGNVQSGGSVLGGGLDCGLLTEPVAPGNGALDLGSL